MTSLFIELIRRWVAPNSLMEICHDARKNELSLKNGGRLLSAYILRSGIKVWVITEGDRSLTCILPREEY